MNSERHYERPEELVQWDQGPPGWSYKGLAAERRTGVRFKTLFTKLQNFLQKSNEKFNFKHSFRICSDIAVKNVGKGRCIHYKDVNLANLLKCF